MKYINNYQVLRDYYFSKKYSVLCSRVDELYGRSTLSQIFRYTIITTNLLLGFIMPLLWLAIPFLLNELSSDRDNKNIAQTAHNALFDKQIELLKKIEPDTNDEIQQEILEIEEIRRKVDQDFGAIDKDAFQKKIDDTHEALFSQRLEKENDQDAVEKLEKLQARIEKQFPASLIVKLKFNLNYGYKQFKQNLTQENAQKAAIMLVDASLSENAATGVKAMYIATTTMFSQGLNRASFFQFVQGSTLVGLDQAQNTLPPLAHEIGSHFDLADDFAAKGVT